MRRAPIVIAWVAGAGLLLAPPPQPPQFRLPNVAVPLRHSVELTIDPRHENFAGSVRIDVDLTQATDILWLNAKDLRVRSASVSFNGSDNPAKADAVAGEFLSLTLDAPVGPGPAAISVTYQGRISDKALVGPYRRKVDGDWYVYTTFTPIEARRAFPCFDEPRFKTPWEVALRVRQDDRAFANAPEASSTAEDNGWKLVRFAPTEPLPAEVVAFAVGPFEVLDDVSPMRVITARGQAAQGRYAAEVAPQILAQEAAYTGIPYAFGKLDLLALPESAYGAVENPGLITFNQRGLLIPEGAATDARRAAVRRLEAHEFAHQWFGDLVTQANWEDVWLSEGFATWMAAKMTGNPLAAIAARERTLANDAAGKLRAVRVPIGSREATEDVYDNAVYDKGAAVLLMVESWLGADTFRAGLHAYLEAHEFGSATTADLAAALTAARPPNATGEVAGVLDTFLDSTGVPRIEGQLECDPGRPARLRVQSTVAGVPLCWKSGTASGCSVAGRTTEIALPESASCPAWFYLNAGGAGYYRTLWNSDPRDALPHLSPAERLTLAYDLRATGGTFAARVLAELAKDEVPEVAAAARAQ